MRNLFFLFAMVCLAATQVMATTPNRLIQLRTDNVVLFRGEVTENSVADVEEKLVDLMLSRKPGNVIYLVLDSPGGDIAAGEAFIQFAKRFKDVQTITLFAASMASAIVEGMPGRRLLVDNGTLMFHRARGGVEGQFHDGELESRLAYVKTIVNSMEVRNANRMGMDLLTYKGLVKDELWLYGNIAALAGAADETVDLVCSKELIEGRSTMEISIMGVFEVKVESSTCPLLKAMRLVAGNKEEKAAFKTYLQTYTHNGIMR